MSIDPPHRDTMAVRFIDGEPFRCFVRSSSRESVEFLVDWESWDFNGECGCENFSLTRIRDVQAGRRSQCKHLRVAIPQLGERLARMVKKNLDQRKPT